MKVLSPERMTKYDSYAITEWGIPSPVLMENAGRSVFRLMKEKYVHKMDSIVIVAGKGNNGGDGFVVARYAKLEGSDVTVYLLGEKKSLKGDAHLNMVLYEKIGGRVIELTKELGPLKEGISKATIVVDAIFGTGLSKEISGIEREAIEIINTAKKMVVAIDIPSGLNGKTGRPSPVCVAADHTFTFAYPKLGHLLYPGAQYTGKLTVIDISIPPLAEDILGWDAQLIDGNMLRRLLKNRAPDSHKGTYGHCAVIAGSKGKTGAAYMASLSALKIGAGLVTLVIPESLNPILEMKTTEVMTYPVLDNGKGYFIMDALEITKEFLLDKDVIILGPGLSQEKETLEFARRIFLETDKPFVIDADGINAFKEDPSLLKHGRGRTIITPHPGEFSRLIRKTTKEINENRLEFGMTFVKEYGVVLVLKGARTLIFDSNGEVYINPTGNPSLAKGGSGDILTGFIGGLSSQGYTLTESAILGTYLHGYMADRWIEKFSEMDLLATDLLLDLGLAIREIKDGKDRVYIEKSI
ncbi:MAG: NAD(P)H-hydrate dehydratase [Deltaproteobacteria bacterium]|nr:NAD(P)H-hydrate dehydratase [Deltaproteobacteria bacterium]